MRRISLLLAGCVISIACVAQIRTSISDEAPTINDPDAPISCPAGIVNASRAKTFRELDPRRLADAEAIPPPGYAVPRMIQMPSLRYPGNLFTRKPGFASVFVVIDATGKPSEPQVVCSSGAKFERASIDAILAATFAPATLDGVAIEDTVIIPIDFKLR